MTAINYQNMVSDYSAIVRKGFRTFEQNRVKQFMSRDCDDQRFKRENEMGKKFFHVIRDLGYALMDAKRIMQGYKDCINITGRVEEGYTKFRQIIVLMDDSLKKAAHSYIERIEKDYLFYIKYKETIEERQKRNREQDIKKRFDLSTSLDTPYTMDDSEIRQFWLDMANVSGIQNPKI